MESSLYPSSKKVAALIHLSTFGQIFFPLGNFIFPLILWMIKRDDQFVDEHGKQALNFQISFFLYLVFLTTAGVCGIFFSSAYASVDSFVSSEFFSGQNLDTEILVGALVFLVLLLSLFLLNIYAVTCATLRAGDGALYRYPLTINFIKNNQNNSDTFKRMNRFVKNNKTL